VHVEVAREQAPREAHLVPVAVGTDDRADLVERPRPLVEDIQEVVNQLQRESTDRLIGKEEFNSLACKSQR
jgi:hypothetical protein